MEDFAPERVCPRCSSRVPATSPCPRCGTPPSRPAPTSSPDADPSRREGPEPTYADSSWSGGPEPAPPYEEPSWRGQPDSTPSSSYRDSKAAASSSSYDDSSWEPRTGWVPGRRRRMPFLLPLLVVVLGGALLAWVLMGGDTGGPTVGASTQASPADPAAVPPDAAPTDDAPNDVLPSDDGTSSDEASAGPSDPEGGWQASAMNGLLSDSRRSRSGIQQAVDAAVRCDASAVQELKKITDARAAQLAEAGELTVDALPGGQELKDTLIEALDAARDADAGFLAWARRHRDQGCTGSPTDDPGYRRGMSRSVDAQAAKERFVELWRPVADSFDLPYWEANDI